MKSTFLVTHKTSIDMKRIIITFLVTLLLIVTTEAKPVIKAKPDKNKTEQVADMSETEQVTDESTDDASGDGESTIIDNDNEQVDITKDGVIIKQEDGTTVKMKLSDLGKFVSKHLDDTLLSIDDMSDASEASEPTTTSETSEDLNYMRYTQRDIMSRGMDLAEDITRAVLIAVVFIVFFSLLFYYMHRRRKYKTVDRAIQAGYPLPNEFFSKNSQHAATQQPTTVYVNQITTPAPDAGTSHGANPAPGPAAPASGNPLNNITDWAPFKSGFTTTAVGIGLLFFFWIAGMEAIAALMLIVIFIGLGRLFVTYQEQQNAKNYWQQQQWNPQQQPDDSMMSQQPQQWQQWNTPQQDDVPSMPDTPPEFGPNK